MSHLSCNVREPITNMITKLTLNHWTYETKQHKMAVVNIPNHNIKYTHMIKDNWAGKEKDVVVRVIVTKGKETWTTLNTIHTHTHYFNIIYMSAVRSIRWLSAIERAPSRRHNTNVAPPTNLCIRTHWHNHIHTVCIDLGVNASSQPRPSVTVVVQRADTGSCLCDLQTYNSM